ncbi:MAG: hypothetical protein IJF65_03860 [Clostridia bacterium]|nr:hypothetical protein [Clostridia bacterium]
MTSLKKLTGLPVVIKGQPMGRVEAGVLSPSGDRLLGLIIRSGLRGAKWIPEDQIMDLGGVCVLAQGLPQRLPRQQTPQPGPVWDPSGLRLGVVADVHLNHLRVNALEISLGPWDDWRFGRMVTRTFALRQEEGVMKVLTPLASLMGKEELHEPW